MNDNVNDSICTCLTYELKFIGFLTWRCFKGIYCLGNCYVIVELHSEVKNICNENEEMIVAVNAIYAIA